MRAKSIPMPLDVVKLAKLTATWTDEQVGVHLRLLAWSWEHRQPVPSDPERRSRIAVNCERCWSVVAPLWAEVEGGLVNHELEQLRAAKDRFSAAQSAKAKRSVELRQVSPGCPNGQPRLTDQQGGGSAPADQNVSPGCTEPSQPRLTKMSAPAAFGTNGAAPAEKKGSPGSPEHETVHTGIEAGNGIGIEREKGVEGKTSRGRSRGGSPGKCLMKNSQYNTFEAFAFAFAGNPEFDTIDLGYYFHAIMDWSSAKGVKMADWIATARNWMRRDHGTGKLKLKGANTTAPSYLTWNQ